ncbi:MAG: tail chaperonin [Bacilli bacterium]
MTIKRERRKQAEQEVVAPAAPEQNQEVVLEDGRLDVETDDISLAEEKIFDGGPTYNQVENWKSQFAGEIYLTEFDEENIFIWRPIKRKEYKDIAKIQNADNFYKEERIVEKVLLWPEGTGFLHFSNQKAGICTLLSELIMEKSGFVAKTGAMRLS